jgi:protein-tyrosine phosphatase/arsenate reductase
MPVVSLVAVAVNKLILLHMFEKIEILLRQLVNNFDEIPAERKVILQKLSVYVKEKMLANEEINLVYICTHNSRRSHFGQVAAAVAASYFKINNVHCFSGGTQVTAFNTNAINALKKLGFEINTKESDCKNPLYQVAYSNTQFEKCFSKLYDDESNPKDNFAAIMTCSDAEQNCPFIAGAKIRIGTTYNDPKEADNTKEVNKVYVERFKQITTETLYAFSLATHQ